MHWKLKWIQCDHFAISHSKAVSGCFRYVCVCVENWKTMIMEIECNFPFAENLIKWAMYIATTAE